MKYYVLFVDGNDRWWMKFLKPGFKHCVLLREYGENLFLYFENLFGDIIVDVVDVPLREIQEETQAIVVEYEVPDTEPAHRSVQEIITCVTTLKKIMGIADIRIQTPYQLYLYLLKNGGKLWADCQSS